MAAMERKAASLRKPSLSLDLYDPQGEDSVHRFFIFRIK
jgi:hypothetical protein